MNVWVWKWPADWFKTEYLNSMFHISVTPLSRPKLFTKTCLFRQHRQSLRALMWTPLRTDAHLERWRAVESAAGFPAESKSDSLGVFPQLFPGCFFNLAFYSDSYFLVTYAQLVLVIFPSPWSVTGGEEDCREAPPPSPALQRWSDILSISNDTFFRLCSPVKVRFRFPFFYRVMLVCKQDSTEVWRGSSVPVSVG